MAVQGKTPAWRAFAQPSAWTMLLFGFGSGLPFLLVAGTLALWLKDAGIELKSITMIASAGLAYAFKFLWAPLLDHWVPPGFGRLGLRRGWLVLAQLGIVAGLLAMAMLTPYHLPAFIAATLAVAVCGATQDIAVDAYRIEIAPLADQGALVATYSLGYRLGLMVGFAFAAMLADHIRWPTVYVIMAATMGIPLVAALVASEPQIDRIYPKGWRSAMRTSVADPLIDFFRRYGTHVALTTLLFLLLFKIPEQATIGGIMSPFYRDMGFSNTQIGAITKIYGVWIGIVGTFLGGGAVTRFGVWRTFLVAIVLCGCSNLLYLLLIPNAGNLWVLTAVISGENLTLGFLGPPTVAFLSSLVNRRHTAAQYALLSSLVNLPGKLLGVFAGGIVASAGYAHFFGITVLAIVPAVALFLYLGPRLRDVQARPERQPAG